MEDVEFGIKGSSSGDTTPGIIYVKESRTVELYTFLCSRRYIVVAIASYLCLPIQQHTVARSDISIQHEFRFSKCIDHFYAQRVRKINEVKLQRIRTMTRFS